MIRQIAAISVAAWLCPAWLGAQAQPLVLTVSAAAANIHRAPTTASPVIGHVLRGTRLEVTRNLGSWVKVSWPRDTDRVGYVHVSTGTLARGAASDPQQPAPATVKPASSPIPPPAPVVVAPEPAPTAPPRPTGRVAVSSLTHLLGVGGFMGTSTLGYGATARAWGRDRIGLQLAASRYAPSSLVPSHLTSMQFEPSLLYTPANYVSDYVWARPYAGSGLGFFRRTLSGLTPNAEPLLWENKLGVQVFGGSEFSFAAVPRFALSADVGYRWPRETFAGVDFGGPSVSVSGHWYVK